MSTNASSLPFGNRREEALEGGGGGCGGVLLNKDMCKSCGLKDLNDLDIHD